MSSLPPTTMPRRGPVLSRPSARPTGPSMPDRPVVSRPASPPTGPSMPDRPQVNVQPKPMRPEVNLPGPVQTNFSPMSSSSPSPSMPAPMKKGGYVSKGGKLNLGSGRVSTASSSKKNPNF